MILRCLSVSECSSIFNRAYLSRSLDNNSVFNKLSIQEPSSCHSWQELQIGQLYMRISSCLHYVKNTWWKETSVSRWYFSKHFPYPLWALLIIFVDNKRIRLLRRLRWPQFIWFRGFFLFQVLKSLDVKPNSASKEMKDGDPPFFTTHSSKGMSATDSGRSAMVLLNVLHRCFW